MKIRGGTGTAVVDHLVSFFWSLAWSLATKRFAAAIFYIFIRIQTGLTKKSQSQKS
jgi:hypothetical protein